MLRLAVVFLLALTGSGTAQADWLEKLQSVGDELKNKASANWNDPSSLLNDANQKAQEAQGNYVAPRVNASATKILELKEAALPAVEAATEKGLQYHNNVVAPALLSVSNSVISSSQSTKAQADPYLDNLLTDNESLKQLIFEYLDQGSAKYNEILCKARIEYMRGQTIILAALPSSETAADTAFSTVVFGTFIGVSVAACAAPVAVVAGTALAAISGAACAKLAFEIADENVEYLHSWVFDRDMDRTGKDVGAAIGTVAGALLGGKFAVKYALASGLSGTGYYSKAYYKDTYRKEADRRTKFTFNAHKNEIDKQSLRGKEHGWDLDHRIPVKCFYNFGLPTFLPAIKWNLQMLTASENRSKGAAGC
jgi:hypothetical protein